MEDQLLLKFRLLNGKTETLSIDKTATVSNAKTALQAKISEAPAVLQQFIADPCSGQFLQDEDRLSSCSNVKNGSVIIVMLKQWQIDVKVQINSENKVHKIKIPSDQDPKTYPITKFKVLVEEKTGYKIKQRKILVFNKKVLKDGTLGSWGIKDKDEVFLKEISKPEVDVCFLMDCTGSMGSSLDTIKNNIQAINDRLIRELGSDCQLRFGFVRYTDYDVKPTYLHFTDSLSQFCNFVNPIEPEGGDDQAEDVMGGLNTALCLRWRASAAKVLIHIADAPCHGTQYHAFGVGDDYPHGDKNGITHDQMMSAVARLDIQYYFGYINNSTDKMISVFNESLRRKSNNRLTIRQFEAEKPYQIADAACKYVSESVFAFEAAKD